MFRRPAAAALLAVAGLLALTGCAVQDRSTVPPGVLTGENWTDIAFIAAVALTVCVFLAATSVTRVLRGKHESAARVAEARARQAEAEAGRLRADLETERSRRTTGGTPPKPATEWAGVTHAPPPSATDDSAPPLRTTRGEQPS